MYIFYHVSSTPSSQNIIADLEETLSREVLALNQELKRLRDAANEEISWHAKAMTAQEKVDALEQGLARETQRAGEMAQRATQSLEAGLRRETIASERIIEQEARIVALNEEWSSLQAEVVAVETRLGIEIKAKNECMEQLSALQDDLNAYVGDSDRREEEHGKVVDAMVHAYRNEKEKLLNTIQQFVLEIEYWQAQTRHYQELSRRIPSNISFGQSTFNTNKNENSSNHRHPATPLSVRDPYQSLYSSYPETLPIDNDDDENDVDDDVVVVVDDDNDNVAVRDTNKDTEGDNDEDQDNANDTSYWTSTPLISPEKQNVKNLPTDM